MPGQEPPFRDVVIDWMPGDDMTTLPISMLLSLVRDGYAPASDELDRRAPHPAP